MEEGEGHSLRAWGERGGMGWGAVGMSIIHRSAKGTAAGPRQPHFRSRQARVTSSTARA